MCCTDVCLPSVLHNIVKLVASSLPPIKLSRE